MHGRVGLEQVFWLVWLGPYLVGAVGSQLNGRVPIRPRARWGRPGWARGGRPRELEMTIARGLMSFLKIREQSPENPCQFLEIIRPSPEGPCQSLEIRGQSSEGLGQYSEIWGPSLEGLCQYLEIRGRFKQHFILVFEILTFQKCVIGEIWLGGDFVRANLMVPGRTYIYIYIYIYA